MHSLIHSAVCVFVHSGPKEADAVCERMEKEKKNGEGTLRIVDPPYSINIITKNLKPLWPDVVLRVVKIITIGLVQVIHGVVMPLALSPFLIGRMFVHEPSWEYSANLVGS